MKNTKANKSRDEQAAEKKIQQCIDALEALSVEDQLIARTKIFYSDADVVRKITSFVQAGAQDLSFSLKYDTKGLKHLLDEKGFSELGNWLNSIKLIDKIPEAYSSELGKCIKSGEALSLREKTIVYAQVFYGGEHSIAEDISKMANTSSLGVVTVLFETMLLEGGWGLAKIFSMAADSCAAKSPGIEQCINKLKTLSIYDLMLVKAVFLFGDNVAREIAYVLNMVSERLLPGMAGLFSREGLKGIDLLMKDICFLPSENAPISEEIEKHAAVLNKFTVLERLKIMHETFFKGAGRSVLEKMIWRFSDNPEMLSVIYDTVSYYGLEGIKELARIHGITFEPGELLSEKRVNDEKTAETLDQIEQQAQPVDCRRELSEMRRVMEQEGSAVPRRLPDSIKNKFRGYLYIKKLVEMMQFDN